MLLLPDLQAVTIATLAAFNAHLALRSDPDDRARLPNSPLSMALVLDEMLRGRPIESLLSPAPGDRITQSLQVLHQQVLDADLPAATQELSHLINSVSQALPSTNDPAVLSSQLPPRRTCSTLLTTICQASDHRTDVWTEDTSTSPFPARWLHHVSRPSNINEHHTLSTLKIETLHDAYGCPS